MRKLFAAVAAAATLIGGMVLSASSAQADGVAAGTTITVNNPQVGHTYTAYKFANFTSVTVQAFLPSIRRIQQPMWRRLMPPLCVSSLMR